MQPEPGRGAGHPYHLDRLSGSFVRSGGHMDFFALAEATCWLVAVSCGAFALAGVVNRGMR